MHTWTGTSVLSTETEITEQTIHSLRNNNNVLENQPSDI